MNPLTLSIIGSYKDRGHPSPGLVAYARRATASMAARSPCRTPAPLVYAWADGIYVKKAGLEKDEAALLVVIGAMSDGRKEVLAIRSGHRESTESWLKVLRDLGDRGLCAPVLLMADGGLPLWSACEQVWPEAAQQRCWNHKIINVLDDLPKRVRGKARALRRDTAPSDGATVDRVLAFMEAYDGAAHGARGSTGCSERLRDSSSTAGETER